MCFLCADVNYQSYEEGKLALHNKRRGANARDREMCSRRYIALGYLDMAVSVLMETDMEKPGFRADCLKLVQI